jgi:hypothetical protein
MFRYRSFKNIGYNNSETPAVYSYETTEDSIAQVSVSGYFSDPRAEIREGDLIVARCTDGSTTLTALNSDSVVAMPAAGDVTASIDSQGVSPVSRSGDGVSSALAAARTAGKALVLSHGVYEISSTITLLSNDKIIIKPTAVLRAATGFSGSMIEVGTNSVSASYVDISGGGTIDANGQANRGIDLIYSTFSEIYNLRIDGAIISPIRVGGSGATGASYEVNINHVHSMNMQVQNNTSSIGVYYQNATDCYLGNCVIVGYRKGIEVGSNSYSIELNKVHVWGRTVHGAMIRGFSLFGTTIMTQCNADTPFDVIGLGGDLYGFYISGNTMSSLLRVFSNNDIGSDVQVDGRIVPYYFTGNSESYITMSKVHGGSAARRFKSFDGGNTTDNFIINKITGPSANYVTAP